MGDRCTVTLTVLASQQDQVQSILKQYHEVPYDVSGEDRGEVDLYFEEVNYGILDGIQDIREAGIPYNCYNSAGSDYGASTEYCRYLENGSLFLVDVSEHGDHIDIDELKARLNNYDELRDYILEQDKQRTPEPWGHQEEYAARYRALKAIAPK